MAIHEKSRHPHRPGRRTRDLTRVFLSWLSAMIARGGNCFIFGWGTLTAASCKSRSGG
jgi:hypothetical protein